MNEGLSSSVAVGVGNVLRHLNGKHPDVVLFLARHAAGASDAIDAALVAVDRYGVDITVRQETGSRTARLPFSAAIDAVPDLQRQLRAFLDQARAAAPDEPLTSLELLIASRASRPHRRDVPPAPP